MRSVSNRKNHRFKNALLIILLSGLMFIAGAIVDSFWGPFISINQLSVVQTIEVEINKERAPEVVAQKVLIAIEKSHEQAERYDQMVSGFYLEIKQHLNGSATGASNAFKGFLLDLELNRLMIKQDLLSGYIITPDLPYFLETYGSRLDHTTFEYLDFRTHELIDHLYDPNYDSLRIGEIVRRIEILEGRLSGSPSHIRDVYMILLDYYYETLAGNTHDFFVNMNTVSLTGYAQRYYETLQDRPDKIGEISRYALENGPPQKKWLLPN